MFNNINFAAKGLDYFAQRQEVLSKNVANIDTPGYKRQDVRFKTSLEDALKNNTVNKLETEIFTDKESYSYRLDGNNVDVDKEMAEISRGDIQFNAISQRISSEFNKFKTLLQTIK